MKLQHPGDTKKRSIDVLNGSLIKKGTILVMLKILPLNYAQNVPKSFVYHLFTSIYWKK